VGSGPQGASGGGNATSFEFFDDDFSTTRMPQDRNLYEPAELGFVQLLFEPGAMLLNGSQGNLEFRSDFRGCFAITK